MSLPRIIFVCGPMRSGTSLAAKLLESHPDYSFGPGKVNQNGENGDFMAKNRLIVKSIEDVPDSVDDISTLLRADLEHWLEGLEGNVVLKDPCTCCSLGVWLDLVEDAAVVVTLRDPHCIAASNEATQPQMEDAAVYIGLHYGHLFKHLARHNAPVAFAWYERLLTHPVLTIGAVAQAFGMEPTGLHGRRPIGKRWDMSLIDRDLWHYRPEDE